MGVVIAPGTVIEDDVVIQHHVTLALKNGRVPVIRKGAYIGAHAIILGDVEIGDGAIIGAGTIITKSVPAKGTYINKVTILNLSEGKRYENSCNT